MTAKAVLCRFLLEGRVLNVRNCHREIGYTNIAREIPRMVEQPFGVVVSRTQMEGKDRYGGYSEWVNYRLNRSEHNLPGIELMKKYVQEQYGAVNPKTEEENRVKKILDQIQLF